MIQRPARQYVQRAAGNQRAGLGRAGRDAARGNVFNGPGVEKDIASGRAEKVELSAAVDRNIVRGTARRDDQHATRPDDDPARGLPARHDHGFTSTLFHDRARQQTDTGVLCAVLQFEDAARTDDGIASYATRRDFKNLPARHLDAVDRVAGSDLEGPASVDGQTAAVRRATDNLERAAAGHCYVGGSASRRHDSQTAAAEDDTGGHAALEDGLGAGELFRECAVESPFDGRAGGRSVDELFAAADQDAADLRTGPDRLRARVAQHRAGRAAAAGNDLLAAVIDNAANVAAAGRDVRNTTTADG